MFIVFIPAVTIPYSIFPTIFKSPGVPGNQTATCRNSRACWPWSSRPSHLGEVNHRRISPPATACRKRELQRRQDQSENRWPRLILIYWILMTVSNESPINPNALSYISYCHKSIIQSEVAFLRAPALGRIEEPSQKEKAARGGWGD